MQKIRGGMLKRCLTDPALVENADLKVTEILLLTTQTGHRFSKKGESKMAHGKIVRNEEILAIKKAIASGIDVQSIVALTGRSKQTVYRIKNGDFDEPRFLGGIRKRTSGILAGFCTRSQTKTSRLLAFWILSERRGLNENCFARNSA